MSTVLDRDAQRHNWTIFSLADQRRFQQQRYSMKVVMKQIIVVVSNFQYEAFKISVSMLSSHSG